MAKLKKQRPRKASNDAPRKKRAREDDFFQAPSRDEELISSEEEAHEEEDDDHDRTQGAGEDFEEDDQNNEDVETADEKRLRVAKAYLEKIRASTKDMDEDDEEQAPEDRLGARDSLVADLLQQEQLEESGRAQRKLAARIIVPATLSEGRYVGRRHRQSVTAIALTEDDSRGFAASKDGLIVHWDIETGSSDKYTWLSQEASTSGSNILLGGHKNKSKKKQGSRNVLALAVSSDGRYLATGGSDRTIHLWDTRTREHLQAFPGHRGAISSLVFRQGTQQLMSAAFDRTIKLWSAEDRSYMDTLYGHQSEVLTIDCLRQERVLSAGRDRTLRLWKIPDETQLVFRGHAASMECCCFITNSEFLSGSDDGSVALWNTMKKKPLTLIKKAHGVSYQQKLEDLNANSHMNEKQKPEANGQCHGNGDIEHSVACDSSSFGVESWVSAMAVCRGSDLAASGAGDGLVHLWALEEDNRNLQALHSLPVKGFVNSLAFAKSGRFLLAGVGQEPRLGRWGRNKEARNGVVLHTLIPA